MEEERLPEAVVAYLLKARTVEPEKLLLLANCSETIFLLGNGSLKTFPRQLIRMQQQRYC
jgi:hypothetical protein